MKIRTVIATVVAVACVSFATVAVQAQDGSLPNNLFPQYYTQGAGQTTAGMYPAPHWVPAHVGHTYGTYQPLMPHEMMYQHSRNYFNFYGAGTDYYSDPCKCKGSATAINVTKVRWQSGCNFMAPLPGNVQPFAGLQYKIGKHRFGKGLSGCGASGCSSCGESNGGGCASGNCAANINDKNYKR